MNASRNQRACATLSLAGKSPRSIAIEIEITVCRWILRHGFSTELVVSLLLGTSKRDYCKRLMARGLLRATSIPPGWPVNRDYYAKEYFTLSDSGLSLAIQHEVEISGYPEIDPLKVRSSTFFHSILFQIETAWRIQQGMIADYKSERMLPAGKAGEKIPDGAWQFRETAGWVLVEIENRDRKETEKLGRFVSGILNYISDGKVAGAIIITHTLALVEHYQKPFMAGAEYFTEWVEDRKRWYARQITKEIISDQLAKCVRVIRFQKPNDIRLAQRQAVQERVHDFLTPINVDDLD